MSKAVCNQGEVSERIDKDIVNVCGRRESEYTPTSSDEHGKGDMGELP